MSQLEKYNILITGGAGFIGSNLVEALLVDSRVNSIRVLDDFSNGKKENLKPFLNDSRFELIEGDIKNYNTCVEACKNIDLISHQAALGSVPRSIKFPMDTHNANVNGTVNVFTAAKEAGIKNVVYASSSSVYGDSETLPKKEEHKGNLLSPYALSKSIAEQYAAMYARNYGMTFNGLRYFNVFGPNQDPDGPYAAVIPLFVKALLNNTSPSIYGDGEQSRDFTYVSNAVMANVLSLFAPVTAGQANVYNVACGYRTTVNELWNKLAVISSKNIKPQYIEKRNGDIPHSLADISKIRTEKGFVPDVAFEQGLVKTFEWYKKQYEV
jgi:UDP-N-acetylglucosamine 4-epimerase